MSLYSGPEESSSLYSATKESQSPNSGPEESHNLYSAPKESHSLYSATEESSICWGDLNPPLVFSLHCLGAVFRIGALTLLLLLLQYVPFIIEQKINWSAYLCELSVLCNPIFIYLN